MKRQSPYPETPADRLIRNMSAPPRSTVCFRPYGIAHEGTAQEAAPERASGLRWLFRADPDALLQVALPGTTQRMRDLRHAALKEAREQDKSAASRNIGKVRALRLAGLVRLAADFAGEVASRDGMDPEDATPEALHDRLVDLARCLPLPPGLPALGIVESLAGGSYRGGPGSTDALPVLWVLTHLNGHTFDRDGLPILAPDLAEGGAYDIYAP